VASPEAPYPVAVALTGEVAEITIHIERIKGAYTPNNIIEPSPESDADWDRKVRMQFFEGELALTQIEPIVRQHLGHGFKVESATVREGSSVEVLIVLSTAFLVLKTVNDVISELVQAVENVRQFVHGLARPLAARVTASYTLLGALAAATTGAGSGGVGLLASALGGNTKAWRILHGWYVPVFLAVTGAAWLAFVALAIVKFG
jgi:hypothetical protein